MLQTKTYNEHDVVTIKLVSGEEVIGYFVSEDAAEIILRKPVVPVPTDDGAGIALAPFLMSVDYLQNGDGQIPYNRTTVITDMLTGDGFKNVYVQTVSGVDLSASTKPGLIM
jgi:hypothetical protein